MQTPDTFLTLSQAAKLLGKGKGTLSNHVSNGKLSAKKQDDGSYKIDPAELARVYPDEWKSAHRENGSETGSETPKVNDTERDITHSKNGVSGLDVQVAVQAERLKNQEQRIAALEAQLERERKAREEAEERANAEREESKRLTLMIAGPQTTPDEPEKPKRGKLARFFLGGEDR